ncbi:glutaredoxin, partial [Terfezia boudieri ATCC MYA-4762]
TELTSILRRSPIIIFSKSYCPHSAAAKHILLALYTLTPPPYIVELDQDPHGQELQAFLKEKTGRGTVPNVLVNGRSLGGGDEVKGLHGEGKLEGVLKRMGGK